MNKKKILILNDGKKFSNWGIQAATDGIINIITEKLENIELIYLPHSILQKNYSFDPTIFGKKLFNRNSRIATRLFSENIEIPRVADEFDFVADKWIEGYSSKGSREVLKLLKEADYIVFNAEGSTYRNNRSAIRALFILWLASNKLNKPSFFLNGSVTITSVDPIIPAIINKTFSQIEGVSVREPESYNNLMEKFPNLKDKIKMIPDSAFSVDIKKLILSKKVKNLDLKKDYFCFSTSMLPIDYVKSKKLSSIYSLIIEIKRIVPNILIFAKDIEDQFLKQLAMDTGATFIGSDYTYEDVIYILSKSKFLLSGRYHHIIFATKVGCPIIPMDTTSHKIIGLSKLFKNTMPYPIDPTNLWTEKGKIIDCIKSILEEKESLRSEYRDIANQYNENVKEHAYVVIDGIKGNISV